MISPFFTCKKIELNPIVKRDTTMKPSPPLPRLNIPFMKPIVYYDDDELSDEERAQVKKPVVPRDYK